MLLVVLPLASMYVGCEDAIDQLDGDLPVYDLGCLSIRVDTVEWASRALDPSWLSLLQSCKYESPETYRNGQKGKRKDRANEINPEYFPAPPSPVLETRSSYYMTTEPNPGLPMESVGEVVAAEPMR